LSSIQPSNPNINIALTEYYNLKTNVGFAADAPPDVSAQAKGGCEPSLPNAAPQGFASAEK
jgi:hypothetical protein